MALPGAFAHLEEGDDCGDLAVRDLFVAHFQAAKRRQAHQDGVDVAAGLEAEQGAAVVEQVELDVAAAEFEQLAACRRRSNGVSIRAPDDLREDVEERLADVAGEGEMRRRTWPAWLETRS